MLYEEFNFKNQCLFIIPWGFFFDDWILLLLFLPGNRIPVLLFSVCEPLIFCLLNIMPSWFLHEVWDIREKSDIIFWRRVVIQFLPKNTRFTYRTKSPWFRNLNSHRKMFSRTSCSSKARNTTVIFYELRFIDFGEMMFSLSLSDT